MARKMGTEGLASESWRSGARHNLLKVGMTSKREYLGLRDFIPTLILTDNSVSNGQGPEKDLIIQDYQLPRTHFNQTNMILFLEASLSTWNGFY